MIRRLSLFLLLVALTAGTAGAAIQAQAQEASPAAEASAPDEGVSFMPIGGADGIAVPTPAMFLAVRVQIEPGASAPLIAGNASSGLFMVEAGTFTVTVDAPWSLTRSASAGGQIETPAAGATVELSAGDVAYVPSDASGELGNDEDLPAIGVIFLVAPASADSGRAATPEP